MAQIQCARLDAKVFAAMLQGRDGPVIHPPKAVPVPDGDHGLRSLVPRELFALLEFRRQVFVLALACGLGRRDPAGFHRLRAGDQGLAKAALRPSLDPGNGLARDGTVSMTLREGSRLRLPGLDEPGAAASRDAGG